MNIIEDFCKDAETISINSYRVEDMFSHKFKINKSSDEIYRDRHDKDGSFIFNMELGLKKNGTLNDEYKFMNTIELFYPNLFSWRFNGHHIECIAKVCLNKSTITSISRYRGENGFIQLMRSRFLEILQYRGDLLITSKIINPHVIATGSINNTNNMWVVDINPKNTLAQIFINSNTRKLVSPTIKTLDMKYWIRELNPDFYREYERFKNVQKYPLSPTIMSKYPPCIHKIMQLKTKGNYARFLLATFLLGVHGERDSKHQLDLMLSDEERQHMNIGNCKDQWRAILSRKYSPPSCKTLIENDYCPFKCSRFGMPTNLEIEIKKDEKTEEVKIK